MHDTLPLLIDHWKNDPHSTYASWFLWEGRLKNFRSIRRGIGQVVRDTQAGTFGNLYRGSTLETVVHSVAEQRQIHTAIVRGYNAVTGGNVKPGRWGHYLSTREAALRLNVEHRAHLSKDFGAIAGLLFDIGSGRYTAPLRNDDANALSAWQADLQKVREQSAAAEKQWAVARDSGTTHTEVQGWLRDLGKALGFDVWIASNDRSRSYAGGQPADGCLTQLPAGVPVCLDSVLLIDVVWVDRIAQAVAAAFEVEHSTSIYSGIVPKPCAQRCACIAGMRALWCSIPEPPPQRGRLVRPRLTLPCSARRSSCAATRWKCALRCARRCARPTAREFAPVCRR